MPVRFFYIYIHIALLFPLPLYANPQKNFEQVFATTVLLTNSDAITFGFSNFDPTEVLNLDDSQQESEQIRLRNQLKVFSLPHTYDLAVINDKYYDQLTFALAYVKQTQEQDFSIAAKDLNTDIIYGGYFAFTRNFKLNKVWTFRSRLGSHLLHHKNKHDYNSAESQQLREQLDGKYFNVEANALLLEPNIRFTYDNEQAWGNWIFSSDYNYFYGWTFAGADASSGARPEGWEIGNTIKTHFTLYDASYHAESLYLKAQRVDIGGDIKPSMGTDHYYEFGVGLLFNTAKLLPWLDNAGIGLNLNVGSQLSGGSIVLYINE